MSVAACATDLAFNYFAYGSNMNPVRLAERLGRGGERLLSRSSATLEGWRLTFDKVSSQQHWVGFANIVTDAGAQVEGTLNVISQKAMEALDAIELVPHHYHRVPVQVRDAKGVHVPAFTYVANPNMVKPDLRPTGDYMEHLLAASDVLPGVYIDVLRSFKCWT